MFPDALGIHLRRMHAELAGDVEPEPQCIDISAGTVHAIMPGDPARQLGERLGRIGNDNDGRLRHDRDDLRHDLPDGGRVGSQQAQAPGGIVAVHRAAGLFIDAYGNEDQLGVFEIGVAAADEPHRRAERRAVLHVRDEPAHAPVVLVDDNDLMRAAAADDGHDARRADGPPANKDHG